MRLLEKLANLALLLGTLAFSAPILAQTNIQGGEHLIATINQAISSVDPNLNIGVVVQSMKYGDKLYSKNEHRPFVPASSLKVMTAEAALIYLGPGYKFKTTFQTNAATVDNGVLRGNLYLVHSGDPTLTYSDLMALTDILKSQHIDRIEGNVYVDTSAYDEEIHGPGWDLKDTRSCYGAPISASIINHNCLSFSVTPAKGVGKLASIQLSPKYFYAGFQNGVVTQSRRCSIRLDKNSDSSISLSGCIQKGRYAHGISTVIDQVVAYNKSLTHALLRQCGIQVGGVITSGKTPKGLTVIATHESKPLSLLINEMLKKSDNIIAGSLFKKLGEKFSKQPGSWENGSRAMAYILAQHVNVNVENLNVIDGSGISPYNQVTPAQLLKVLHFAYHHEGTNYEFVSGLPVAGVDGTLKHRLYNIAWKVRAKTGTISGVNSLAGYAMGRNKEPLAFVIIINGHLGLGWKYKALEDKIVTALTQFSR